MRRTKKPVNQMTIGQFEAMFPNEDACCAYLVAHRWPEGIRCPRCGNADIHPVSTKPWHWQCYKCAPNSGYRFSHLVGTIFENTNMPLRDWFRVIHMMLTSKKGVSALQIHRVIGTGSYRTAWYMCHRVRVGMQDREFCKLVGVVEVDETFIGGKAHNRHKNKRGKGGDHDGGRGGIGSGKTPVAGAISRKGNVCARVVEGIDAHTLTAFVRECVSNKVSVLVTDQWTGYRYLKHEYPHEVR